MEKQKIKDERSIRLDKIEQIKKIGVHPYPEKFDKKDSILSCTQKKVDTNVQTAGRLISKRDMGKISFGHIKDIEGKIQIVLQKDNLQKDYDFFVKFMDVGDHIGINGNIFITQKGEKSILVKKLTFLGKAIRPLPEKFHKIKDIEKLERQRYLDLIMNDETVERFQIKNKFIQLLRQFYFDNKFTEVETPIFCNKASGALAQPFSTHYNAHNMDVFLRIAPEMYLKRLIIGGYDKIFELAKCFRNEGMDPSHLQEFTMLEHYCAYWNFEDNMKFTEKMLEFILKNLCETLKINILNKEGETKEVDFTPPYPRIPMRDLILDKTGIDIYILNNKEKFSKAIKDKRLEMDKEVFDLGFGNMIDEVYKKHVRPYILGPIFVISHPIELSPLARKNDKNENIVDRFQLLVNGWELINAYSELVDPVDQKERFEKQAKLKAEGDADAHGSDDDFIKAMEYGMPPISGWGMGIERIVSLIAGELNLRSVVYFPLMKPKNNDINQNKGIDINLDHISDEKINNLVYKYVSPEFRQHLRATQVAMEKLCEVLKDEKNKRLWSIAGLLHDIDWEYINKDANLHCDKDLEKILKEIDLPNEFINILKSHYKLREIDLDNNLKKALYSVDELTGFITACVYVRPSKSIMDLKVSSVKKKLKDKSFAAQVDREVIFECEKNLNMSLDDLILHTIEAMKTIHTELGI